MRVNLGSKRPVRKNRFRKFLRVSFYTSLFLIVFGGMFFVDAFYLSDTPKASFFRGFVSKGSSVLNAVFDPELKHHGYLTSALLVGIDTRQVAFDGKEFISTSPAGQAGTRNTDTLLQVVYDHETGNIFMISIPRDLGVDIVKDCLEFHGSIHWVYDKSQTAGCPGGGVDTLIETVESVTGIKIQYYGFVTLEAFIDVVNTVGETNSEGLTGINIDNPTTIWESYPYGETGWESVYFPEGEIFLSAEDALKYVRSRQTTTDFGRARRQQIFIEAVLKRMLKAENVFNPKKVISLLNTFKTKTLFSQPSIKEISAGLELLDGFSTDKIINIVLDPNLGGEETYLNKQPHDRAGGPYYMVPTHWESCLENTFCRINKYIEQTIDNPQVYQEEAMIYVYGRQYSGGYIDFSNAKYQEFVTHDYPLNISESRYLATIDRDESVILLDHSEGTKPKTLHFLENKLGVKAIDDDQYRYLGINDENFSILVKP